MKTKTRWPACDIDKRFEDTVFVIEATQNEQFCLWEKRKLYNIEWKEDCVGFLETVGTLDNRPVNIVFTFAYWNGKRICFYEPVSQVVDHAMIEKWFEANFWPTWDNGTRRAHCDAANIHHCLDAISPNFTSHNNVV